MSDAKYGGVCGGCDERIRAGQKVAYVDDELVHATCVDVPGRVEKKTETCTECWLEKPCPCDDERTTP